jgi:hypothetical protein
MIRITDSNQHYRRVLESDPTGMAPRQIMLEVQTSRDTEIWVWDGFGGNDRRRALYPDYKMNRQPLKDSIGAGMKFMKDILRHTNAIQVTVPGYEADDVIATLARTLPGKIHIRSTDMDLLALTNERVTCEAKPKHNLTPDLIKLYKMTVGDPSDNIKGVKGFGAQSWDNANKEELARYVAQVVAGNHSAPTEIKSATTLVKLNCLNWMANNREMLRIYDQIISFFDVPAELIDKHTKPGNRTYAEADAKLKEFFL